MSAAVRRLLPAVRSINLRAAALACPAASQRAPAAMRRPAASSRCQRQFFARGLATQSSGKDGIQWVLDDHEKLKGLFAEYDKVASGRDHKAKGALCDAIIACISSHSSCEEQHLYPLMKQKLGSDGVAVYERAMLDDNATKLTMAMLEKLSPVKDELVFHQTMAKLKRCVLGDHMVDEEVWLEKLRKATLPEERAALHDMLTASHKTAPTHPHPMGPSRAAAAKIMHPIVGAMDRAKDKVEGTAHTSVRS